MAKNNEINQETDLAFLLFHHADEVEGTTKLQKLFFLLEQESAFNEVYDDVEIEFEPYKYGPFSEQIYDELEMLILWDVIEEEEMDTDVDSIRDESDKSSHANKRFTLTEKGEKVASEVNRSLDDDIEEEFEEIVDEYLDMSVDDLLEYVYKQYPDYTTKSEIKDEVLE